MSEKDTGGPAFPATLFGAVEDDVSNNIYLRDYFAIKALQGMLTHSTRYRSRYSHLHWHDAISQEAYEIADSMLQARK